MKRHSLTTSLPTSWRWFAASVPAKPITLEFCLLLGLTLYVGCRGDLDSKAPGTKKTVATNSIDENPKSAINPFTKQEPTSPPDPPKPRRVVFLGSRAPVLVDLFVTQGERALDDVASESAREMLAGADEDQDGSISWEEIAGYEGMSGGGGDMMGRLPRGRQREMLFRAYDANRNGNVDEAELIRFYNRGQVGVDWLVMRTTLNVAANDISAPLARWLDVNRNEKLEPTEIESAGARLMMKDGNDDGVLQESEFQESSPATRLASSSRQMMPASAFPAFLVTEDAQWSELLYRLQRKYTFGAPLLVEDTKLWTAAFDDLDEDGDGTIGDEELAAVADRPADLRVSFRLPSLNDYRASYQDRDEDHNEDQDDGGRDDQALIGSITVDGRMTDDSGDAGEPLSLQRGTAVPTDTSAGTLIFALANESLSGPSAEQLALGFDRLDQDDDDALSESEFALFGQSLRLSFEEIDTDEDDKVTREELEQGLSPATRLATIRVELWMLPQNAPIFTALDQDHNGQLDAVEIERCSDRLSELDTDQDGIVQSTETDFGMFVVLRNAPPGNAVPPPTPAQFTRAVPSEIESPAWFRATDANRDGTINRWEFLGEIELFDRLDADHNGALSVTEATTE